MVRLCSHWFGKPRAPRRTRRGFQTNAWLGIPTALPAGDHFIIIKTSSVSHQDKKFTSTVPQFASIRFRVDVSARSAVSPGWTVPPQNCVADASVRFWLTVIWLSGPPPVADTVYICFLCFPTKKMIKIKTLKISHGLLRGILQIIYCSFILSLHPHEQATLYFSLQFICISIIIFNKKITVLTTCSSVTPALTKGNIFARVIFTFL